MSNFHNLQHLYSRPAPMISFHGIHPWSITSTHDLHPWSSSVISIHDIHPWSSHMNSTPDLTRDLLHGLHPWSQPMTSIHDLHSWSSPMTSPRNLHLRSLPMISTHELHLRYSPMTSPWSPSMISPWSPPMISPMTSSRDFHHVHPWSSPMILTYEIHPRSPLMTSTDDLHSWYPPMISPIMSTYDLHLWPVECAVIGHYCTVWIFPLSWLNPMRSSHMTFSASKRLQNHLRLAYDPTNALSNFLSLGGIDRIWCNLGLRPLAERRTSEGDIPSSPLQNYPANLANAMQFYNAV